MENLQKAIPAVWQLFMHLCMQVLKAHLLLKYGFLIFFFYKCKLTNPSNQMQSSKQSIRSLHLFTYFLWVRELLPKLKYKIYAGINAWAAAFFDSQERVMQNISPVVLNTSLLF